MVFRLEKDDIAYLKTFKVKPYEELQILVEVKMVHYNYINNFYQKIFIENDRLKKDLSTLASEFNNALRQQQMQAKGKQIIFRIKYN